MIFRYIHSCSALYMQLEYNILYYSILKVIREHDSIATHDCFFNLRFYSLVAL